MRAILRKRLADARSEAAFALELFQTHGSEALVGDRTLSHALERACELVGEALRAALESEPTIVTLAPDLPWKSAIALRTRLAHGYDRVDVAVLVEIVEAEFPALVAAIDTALSR